MGVSANTLECDSRILIRDGIWVMTYLGTMYRCWKEPAYLERGIRVWAEDGMNYYTRKMIAYSKLTNRLRRTEPVW